MKDRRIMLHKNKTSEEAETAIVALYEFQLVESGLYEPIDVSHLEI